jgi:hypothetical protein
VLAERPPALGDDEERRAPDLKQQIAGDEQPRSAVERIADRGGHQQGREHQTNEQQSHRQPARVEPVRPPRGHVPAVQDREGQDQRLSARA